MIFRPIFPNVIILYTKSRDFAEIGFLFKIYSFTKVAILSLDFYFWRIIFQ